MSTDIHLTFAAFFVVWTALVVLCIRRTARLELRGVGLPAAMLLAMSFLYGGAFVYGIPGYSHLRPDGDLYLLQYQFTDLTVLKGLGCSLLGIAAFVLGTGSFSRPKRPRCHSAAVPTVLSKSSRRSLYVLGGAAAASYLLNYFRVAFPMSHALLEVGRNTGVALVCVGLLLTSIRGNHRQRWMWMGIAALIPAYYLFGFAFVSYGFIVLTIFGAFWLAAIRTEDRTALQNTLRAALIIYALLAVFVAWMSFREEIRSVIWSRGFSVGGVSLVIEALTNTQMLSPWNFAALDQINTRLNLPLFIGKVIEWHDLHPHLREHGATLAMLAFVVVPRFLLPEKLSRGGSDFMTEHTGMHFSDAASFGLGPIGEFYINFGYFGVFFGCLFLGWAVRAIDKRAADSLMMGRPLHFARWFLVGIALVDPLNRPFFAASAALLSWIVLTVVLLVFSRGRSASGSSVPRLDSRRLQP